MCQKTHIKTSNLYQVSLKLILQDRQHMYKVILRGISVTIAAVEKSIGITYPECVFVALVTRHAKRMRRIILVLPSVASPVPSYFATLSHKRKELKKDLLSIKCVF